ncbi:hypothetical protein [Stutzerimonas nitrititolerans]|uniref:hypothetical protein n=1 Tax=Stutzerimonas nitrititolerans TaxID=2482751 RepID=UPI0028980AEC|nr:hypothetical protein [Stutzerimonas nitrititolerans]
MDIRAIIVEANSLNIIQDKGFRILKMQKEVENFVADECLRLASQGTRKPRKRPDLHSLPTWQFNCVWACENEFFRCLQRVNP